MTTENSNEHPQSAAAAQPLDERPRARTGPIVWGAIVLAFCLYVATQTFAPGSLDATTFIIVSIIGLGLLLLLVGIAVLVRNSRRQ